MFRLLIFSVLLLCASAFAKDAAERIGPHTVHRLELDNGFRVLALKGTNETADVFLAIGTGNRDESHQTSGIAHLTEHALFTGTPTTGPQKFEETVESWGGKANAYTRDDYTMYYDVGVPLDRLPELLAMEADRMQNLAFEPAAFAFEQERLRKEEAGTFTFQMELAALTDSLAYPDHGYGAGLMTNRHTRAPWLSMDAVRQFYRQHYRADKMAAVIVSPNPEQALAAARTAFAPMPASPAKMVAAEPANAPLAMPRLRVASSHTLERPVTDPLHLTVHRLPPLAPAGTPELAPQLDLLGLLLERHASTMQTALRVEMNTRLPCRPDHEDSRCHAC